MRLFSKLFNIRSTEWPHVSLLFLMAIVTNMVAIWGATIAYAAFLKQVGLGALPRVLVVGAVLSVLAIAIYTAFVDRVPNHKLLVAIYAVGAVCVASGVMLLWLNRPSIAYPVLYLLDLAWTVAFNSHVITYINSFYDVHSAKRVVPVVSAGFRTGAIVAGLTMSLLTAWLAPRMIVVIWLLTFVVIAGLVWLMPYLLKGGKSPIAQSTFSSPTAPATKGKERPSYIENMREGFHYIARSTYLRWMAVGTLLLMVLLALVEYRSSGLLLEIYGTSEELASFLALLLGVGNIFVLPMLLLGISRIIARLGLGNTSTIFPVGNLAICGGLIFAPGLVSASAAYLDRTAFRASFQSPVDNLLYNAVPLRVKGRARAFVGGLVVPVGTLLGGLLLLLPQVSTVGWFVPTLIGALAAAYLAGSLIIRRQYSQALVDMLEQEDYSFLLLREASDLTIADPATLKQLHKKLEESTSHEFIVFVAKLISQIGGSQAVPILEGAARAAAEARTRAAIIDIFVAANLRGDVIRQLYTDFLMDPDGEVRQSAVTGLEELTGPADKQFLSQMLDMVRDPDLDVRVRVLSALARCGDFYQLTPAVRALDRLLADENPQRRAHGVRVLGEIRNHRAIRDLAGYLDAPTDEVRLEAAVAMEALSQNALPNLKATGSRIDALVLEKMSSLLGDPIERVRQAALVVLGRIGTRESHQAIVDALVDSSPQVRAAAVDALAQVGRSVVPIVHPKLDSSIPQLRKMAAVTLSRIDPRAFGPLIISSNITGNLLTIYRNYGLVEALTPCTKYHGMAVLQSALRERNHSLADEIFFLLTAVHDPHAIQVIEESLHSENPRTRANAVEALETLTTPQIASLIAPLFEPDVPLARLLSLSQDTWEMEHPSTTRTIQQLATNPDDPWLRAMAVFALGELGAALAPKDVAGKANGKEQSPGESSGPFPGEGGPAPPDKMGESKRQKRRRTPPADLWGVIVDDSGASEASPEGQPRGPDPNGEAGAAEQAVYAEAPSQPKGGDILLGSGASHSEAGGAQETDPLPEVALNLPEIEALLEAALADPVDEVRFAAQAAKRVMGAGGFEAGLRVSGPTREEGIVLSTIEKVIFLKEVPFFQGMTVDQLRVLASVCEEELFEEDARIFNEGDPGGALYMVVSGRVGIEREKRKGSFARVATVGAHSYFGEITLFDNSPRTASAVAIQDTLTLRLRREPLIALARQYPDVSLKLIQALSTRLREANTRIAELTRTRPRQLHKLFDQFD